MVENVQCPVCTLFLHVGMNLSDHLETHPKEQVIQALVQMTISGISPTSCTANSASFLNNSNTSKDETPPVEITLPVTVAKSENVLCDSSATLAKSQKTKNPVFDIPLKQDEQPFTVSYNSNSKRTLPNVGPEFHGVTFPEMCQKKHSSEQQLLETPAIDVVVEKDGVNCLAADYKLPNYHVKAKDPKLQPEHLLNQFGQPQQQFYSASPYGSNQQNRPFSPITESCGEFLRQSSSTGVTSMSQERQKNAVYSNLNANKSVSFISTQDVLSQAEKDILYDAQLIQHRQLNSQTNPSAMFSSSQQYQDYSLYNSNQMHHQRPPPTYGTAINQIRSQCSQKTNSVASPEHMETTHVATTSCILTEKAISQNTASSRQLSMKMKTPFAGHHQQSQFTKQQQEIRPSTKNGLDLTIVQQSISVTYQDHAPSTFTQAPLPLPPPPPPPPSLAATSPPNQRSVSSQYPLYFKTAMMSLSSSSVLRYAETPVTAHYLERDNGDFIVQETPKHIVECVEKDNGEFSVIERIYQSPPSVLHIHDEDEDEDEDVDQELQTDKTLHVQTDDRTKKVEKAAENKEDELEVRNNINTNVTNDANATPSKLPLRAARIYAGDEKATQRATSAINSENALSNNLNVKSPSSSGMSSVLDNSSSTSKSTISTKKSSKNTITVLSDVQLNLSEYLDLVGNIMASSKPVAKCTPKMLQPFVKIEKFEAADEYENEANERVDMDHSRYLENNKEEMTLDIEIEDKTVLEQLNGLTTATLYMQDDTSNVEISLPNQMDCGGSSFMTNECNDANKITDTTTAITTTTAVLKPSNERVLTENVPMHCSQATSVIRMAIASNSQHCFKDKDKDKEKVNENEINKVENMERENEMDSISNTSNLKKIETAKKQPWLKLTPALDLAKKEEKPSEIKQESHNESHNNNSYNISGPVTFRKGPKKLVIKPLRNQFAKTDASKKSLMTPFQSERNEQPMTSAMAQKQLSNVNEPQIVLQTKNISIKCEPLGIDGSTSTTMDQPPSSSVCSMELNIGLESSELKIKSEKEDYAKESNKATAATLLDFGCDNIKLNSSSNAIFPSSDSLFACSMPEKSATISNQRAKKRTATQTKATADANAYNNGSLSCDSEFIVPDVMDDTPTARLPISLASGTEPVLNNTLNSHAETHQPEFSEYPFSFLYSDGATNMHLKRSAELATDSQIKEINNSMGTSLISGSDSTTNAEFEVGSQRQNHQQSSLYASTSNGMAPGQWYHSVSTSNTDFDSLAVDCSGTADSSTEKYLDLDSCKHGGDIVQIPSSTSSCSTAATDSNLASGCTRDALNIRTDEKMPAKGEISEQESNCDIENSWSQPMYGDLPVRFFKSSFPGLFYQENGFNNEDFLHVQDLSTSAGAAATALTHKSRQGFDFRLSGEIAQSSAKDNFLLQHDKLQRQHQQQPFLMHEEPQRFSDCVPSTSTKKPRNKIHVPKTDTVLRERISGCTTATTITSMQLDCQNFEGTYVETQREQHSPMQVLNAQENISTTSTTVNNNITNLPIARQRRKVYQCVHCPSEFSKLKDRNSHMVLLHNYVRQNRRLIRLLPTIPLPPIAPVTTSVDGNVISFGAAASNSSAPAPCVEDSKQGIIKVEMDQTTEQIRETDVPVDASAAFTATKIELKNEDGNFSGNSPLQSNAVTPAAIDQKVQGNQRSHTTKLANLYRMLIGYNLDTLKQNQTLSIEDEDLMKASIFFCCSCRERFSSVKLYDAHLTLHPAECFSCGKKFQRWKNFSLHLKRHLGWKEFGCTVCDKKFVVRSALVEHMRMHTGHNPLKCKICGKYFKRYSNLTQHRKRHGRVTVRKKEFVCHCGAVLPSKARFLWHKETHDAKPKCCPHCCDRFVHANSLRRHIRLAHSDKFDYSQPMECPMCKQVMAKASMRAHMATHSVDQQHDCPICNKTFSTKWNLKIHSWVHANRTAKPFKCEHCPKAFVREVDFKNHINAHKQIKPYTCEYCGCKFIRKYNYMRHRREHHGNKKYTCDLCKKTFHRHYYLIEHKRIHTGERPFQCSICGKSSTTKTNHNKHLKIHHSRDPFTVEA